MVDLFFGLVALFLPSFFLLFKKLILIIIFYFNNFILFYFTFFFISFFSPFYAEPCGWQALGAPARHQVHASEVGEPTSEHWSTRDLPAPRNTKRQKFPRDLHLNIKTQLQCWTPYAKQLARQEHNPIH